MNIAEEELKRLHAAGYGQVGFNYEAGAPPSQPPEPPPQDVDEPFLPDDTLKSLLLPHIIFVCLLIYITVLFIGTM